MADWEISFMDELPTSLKTHSETTDCVKKNLNKFGPFEMIDIITIQGCIFDFGVGTITIRND